MANSWGGLEDPAVAGTEGEAPGDPALSRLGAFFAAFLYDRARVGIQAAIPVSAPVKTVCTFDPEEGGFNKTHLPALYLFRDGDQTFEREGEDYLQATSKLTVLWICAPTDQPKTMARRSLVNLVSKTLALAVDEGRTPSYIVPGDPDEDAEDLGSQIRTQIGAWKLELKRTGRHKLAIKTGTGQETYFGLKATFDLVENQEDDLSLLPEVKLSLDVEQSTNFAAVFEDPVVTP